ncbi:hypothetical protein E2C01_063620 [Portunus trituberculatus]|uniref:Uncharacterized protein n=1 Tax=Portunus trituberculatus TaxID=210409 RepID=A0A5B7HJH7_PORTR|nr:hypothetical protein [Portunus trituberculatus]
MERAGTAATHPSTHPPTFPPACLACLSVPRRLSWNAGPRFARPPVGTLEEYMWEALFSFRPISGTGNSICSGTHISAHVITQAHLWCNHLEPGYRVDM